MKKNVSILAFAVVALLASCSNEGVESNPNFPSDGIIRVTTGLGDLTSRAGQNNTSLALFNLSVSYPNNSEYSQYACMKKDLVDQNKWDSYSAANDGATPFVMKFKDGTTPMVVTALGVNNENRLSTYFTSQSVDSVLVDQSKEDSVKASDIVYMARTVIDPKTSPLLEGGKLKINLEHRFSKLKFVLTLGNDFNPAVSKIDDIKNVQVKGLKRKFRWNPSVDTESLTLDENSIDPITPYGIFDGTTGSGVATYECVVVPQEVVLTAFKISFMINGKSYEVTLKSKQTLQKNVEYTIPATVQSKESPVTGKFSASNWKKGDEVIVLNPK